MQMSLSDGRKLDLLNPCPEKDLTLYDTAWALAQTNQFTGRARFPFSVAAHSLLVAKILVHEFDVCTPARKELVYWALMHDAHEAVVGDVSTPVKWAMRQLGLRWDEFDAMWRAHYEKRFCYCGRDPAVKAADTMALAVARKVLMEDQSDWPVINGVDTPKWACDWVKGVRSRRWKDIRGEWYCRAACEASSLGLPS